MNERIQELIKQAQINDLAIDTNGDLYDVKRLDPEKFAELIVKETMQVVANNLAQNTYLDVACAVIEHFKE